MKNISFRNDVLPLKNELYRLALRITLNNAEAEDIVQETLIRVWKKKDEWENIDSIEAFSLTICRNLSLDHTKKMEKVDFTLDNDNHDSEDISPNPYEQLTQNDRVELVKRLINELPERQRSVMQLRDVEGKSYKEISIILNMSEEQVKINIFRARQRIKQKYSELENYGL
ncbi:MAG: RNA polymerase sigma factor [Bacteroidaceae bacterium]|nr:RNA polymerase sigma factor [Bacteroidaceae bacterium]